jgi:hypothetical protein
MKPASEILRAAARRITPPNAWTRNCFARDRFGEFIDPWDESAVAWCAIGAIDAEADGKHELEDAILFMKDETGGSPSLVNDADPTRWDILAAIYRAAARAESEGR